MPDSVRDALLTALVGVVAVLTPVAFRTLWPTVGLSLAVLASIALGLRRRSRRRAPPRAPTIAEVRAAQVIARSLWFWRPPREPAPRQHVRRSPAGRWLPLHVHSQQSDRQ